MFQPLDVLAESRLLKFAKGNTNMRGESQHWMSLSLKFDESGALPALELSSFIFDVNRLYVAAFRELTGQVGRPPSGASMISRSSFRLHEPHQLQISRIRFDSPGLIELMTATSLGFGSILVLLKIIEKITSWKLNRDKLKAETRKAALEAAKLLRDNLDLSFAINSHVKARAEPYLIRPEFRGPVSQLNKNPIKPIDLTVEAGEG